MLANHPSGWKDIASLILAGILDACWPKITEMLSGFLLNYVFDLNMQIYSTNPKPVFF